MTPNPQAKTISEILDRYFLANQKGQFEDDQGNICWYLDDLAKNIPIATKAITQAMLDIGEKTKIDCDNGCEHKDTHQGHEIIWWGGYNLAQKELRAEIRTAIKKVGGKTK